MINLIGICGPLQNGKDTICKIIQKMNTSYVRVAYADKLKEIALAIDPYVVVQPATSPTGLIISRVSELVATVGWDEAKALPDVRRFLQRIGTDAMRVLVSDRFWLDQHAQECLKYSNVIAPDVRFPNEEEDIHKRGGILIRVHDPRKPLPPIEERHASEKFCMELKADIEIINDGSIGDLTWKVADKVGDYLF